MAEVASQFYKENGLHSTEGKEGLECLALLCRRLGYKDISYYGQFNNHGMNGQLGDVLEFLEDNPGAIAAILNWVNEQNIPEWEDTDDVD